jgi:23S rRNA pseudouridine1911/1915/1917 synthase
MMTVSPVDRIVIATRADVGERLDLVLRRHLTDVGSASRTRVQAWIEHGAVAVNGHRTVSSAARAALGDVIGISLPDAPARIVMDAEDISLDVLFEDEHFVVVNKAAGLVVHPTYKHRTGTLMNALLWHARQWPSGQRPSLVGRLDKLTSGVVLAAKSAAMHAALQRALATTAGEKDYLALVYGRVTAERGTIDLRLARDRSDRRRVVASTIDGAPSTTQFERLASTRAPAIGLALLRCRLMTGRTHQIRVHLSARGWPIVGDPTYGCEDWQQIADPVLAAALQGFPRQALHAWRISFAHPVTGVAVEIQAPVPLDMTSLLQLSGLSVGHLNL